MVVPARTTILASLRRRDLRASVALRAGVSRVAPLGCRGGVRAESEAEQGDDATLPVKCMKRSEVRGEAAREGANQDWPQPTPVLGDGRGAASTSPRRTSTGPTGPSTGRRVPATEEASAPKRPSASSINTGWT